MRAIEYGLLHNGNYSYKDVKSNIYAFNNEISVVNDETNEEEGNSYTEIVYIEIEPYDGGNSNEFNIVEGGEILDVREGNYILNSNVIPVTEITEPATIHFQNSSSQAVIYKFDDKYFALITKSEIGAIEWNFLLENVTIIATTTTKKKKREKITLLNDVLKEKQLSVVLFISKDGAQIETAYQSIDDLYENEIVLFIETNDKMNIFGSVVRIKTGSNVTNTSGVPSKKLSKVVDYFNTSIHSSSLLEIIKEHIADKSSNLFLVKKVAWGLLNKVVGFSTELTLEGIETISNGIAELVGTLKLSDSQWQYYDENGEPLKNTNLFLPGLQGIQYLQAMNKKGKPLKPEETNANAINKILYLEQKLKEQKKDLSKASFFKKIINQLLYMLGKVKEFLSDPLGKALDFAETAFVMYNAFIVGIINSIIDAIKGIFDIISLICQGLIALRKKGKNVAENLPSYLSLLFEMIENMIETFTNLFSKENLKALVKFFKKCGLFMLTLPTRIFSWLAEGVAMPNLDKVAYYIGYIIGFIIQLILEILFTGGAKTVADAFKKLADSLISIFKTMKSVAFKLKEGAVIAFENLLAIFAYIREKSKNLGFFLENLFNWLNELFASLKSKVVLSSGLTYSFIDPITIFAKFFYNLTRKKWWGQLHDLGVAVAKNEEGLYTFLYKNEEIANGLSKSEVESYLKDLFSKTRKSADETTAYLDDLAETVKLRKAAFTKWASKFEKKFHIHFDGEIYIGKASNRDKTPVLWAEGAHNHAVNGIKIEIGTIRNPPGVKFENLPDDIPFKANVNIKYSNRNIPKQNTSSFFPKNWNIQRVREEIALVYDDMVKNGFELKYENNKYFMNSKHGFDIQIELDKLGNITSAYPKIN